MKLPFSPKIPKLPPLKLPNAPALPTVASLRSFGRQLRFGRLVSLMSRAWRSIDRYLNGTINLRFMSHRLVRWSIAGLIFLYLVVGLMVGWKIYRLKAESTNLRRILIVYPFPAVLMPQDIILVRDYLNQLKYIRHFADKTKKPLPPENELRTQLINQMIETKLLLNTNRQYGVRVSKADIDAAFKKIAEANGGEGEVVKVLQDLYGMSQAEFRQLIRDQLLREKVRKDVLRQVQVKHILLRTDEKKARQLLDELKKDPSRFDELAKQNTEDTISREKNGDIGFVARGVLDQSFDDVAFKLKKDELAADLVKTRLGWHIIKVIDERGYVDQSYQDFVNSLRKKQRLWVLIS